MNTASARLYETDFYGWIQQQADRLRARNFAQLDIDNLTEEIQDMGRSEKRELRSRLTVLFLHLLKWQYQPARRGRSWELSIKEQRFEIGYHLAGNPSLKPLLPEIVDIAWQGAKIQAERETGLNGDTFPAQCPWTFEQAMDEHFWPATPAPQPA